MKQEIWIFNDGTPATTISSAVAITQYVKRLYQDKFILKQQNGLAFQNISLQALSKKVALIIIPGGAGQAIYKNLGEEGNQKIKAYINDGGHYLGICAGAYYAARETQFEVGRGEPYEIKSDTNAALGFYPGIARGSAYGIGHFIYNSAAGAHLANVNITGNCHETIMTYFNGGCYFYAAKSIPNIEILAYYADFNPRLPAIVKCEYGKGRAILSGVHFEYDEIKVDLDYVDKCVFINKALHENKKAREQFVRMLFKRLVD